MSTVSFGMNVLSYYRLVSVGLSVQTDITTGEDLQIDG